VTYSDDFDRAKDLAKNALDRVLAERLSPNPENFTLWYAYFSGQFPDLTRAIDIAQRDTGTLSQVHCDELFKRFFTLDAEAQAIRETSERARAVLGKVMELLDVAGTETHRYGTAMAELQGELEQPLSMDELRAMVAAIAAETTAIIERQARLQSQFLESSQQLAEMRINLDTARREAMTDGLTGIANRKAFDIALNDAIQVAGRESLPLSLLMMDIDHFKLFNDAHGHLVGDHVLRLVAKVLTECIKGRDTAARYGGEEFTIILPRTSLANALALAEQIRVAVGSRQIVNRSRNASYGSVTLSIGVAELQRDEPAGELVRRADAALYTAKHAGRNRVSAEVDGTLDA
jgi:diguanylate cyclase